MPEITQVAVALIAAISAVIGSFLVWQSNRGTRATTTLDMALKQLNDRVTEQDEKIADLTARLDKKDKELLEQQTTIRELQDRERDRDELLADYREHTLAHQLWLDDGGTPPSPVQSWRIRMDLKQLAQESEVG